MVTGPSGVGKSTILREVLRRTGAAFSVSATTRDPRSGEVDGRDYYFVSRDEFERWVDQGRMLEWARVFDRLYGTPAGPVDEQISRGGTVVLDIDVQGARQVHEKRPEATFVFILPPSLDDLRTRLAGRGSETSEQMEKRLSAAEAEIRAARDSGIYNHFVVNDDLETATNEVTDLIRSEEVMQDDRSSQE